MTLANRATNYNVSATMPLKTSIQSATAKTGNIVKAWAVRPVAAALRCSKAKQGGPH